MKLVKHAVLFLPFLIASLGAQVSSVEIESRAEIAAGQAFGSRGAYEQIEGRIRFALDPANPFNQRIIDLGLAPHNEDGLVEAVGDLVVLQAVDPEQRSGIALLEVSNRGGRASLGYFNRAGGGNPFGDGLLMRMGITVIWVGWQFDVPRGLRLEVPRAHPDGDPITGLVRSDWTVDRAESQLGLGHRNHRAYPPLDPDSEENRLTWRSGRDAERVEVSTDLWAFTEDGSAITVAGGFKAGRIYELVYRAKDPAVVGLGLAAIRDTIAYAKYEDDCAFPVQHGVAVGISQTGRFLRQYLYQGFNTDSEGRQALDGMMILTAGAGRGSFNHRFAQPSRDAHRYSAFFYPTDIFPFSTEAQEDSIGGQSGALLANQHKAGQLPKIFAINTGYEYWGRAAALVHSSVDGKRDLSLHSMERVYHVTGTQHFPGSLRRGNPIELRTLYRALLANMVSWVEQDLEPPPSRFPRIADETLVPVEALADPEIPGLVLPAAAHTAYRANYGSRWAEGIVSIQPPELGATYASLVPQIDSKGNEIAGLRPLEIRVPVATYTPWSLRSGMAGGNGELRDFVGSYLPFAPDEARVDADDPRPTLEELYGDEAGYRAELEAAADQMILERFLLAEDREFIIAHCLRLWQAAQSGR
ncbi:MAG: alpha/beta hydrolase domain-containing protein [Planctomycetota bacterium]|jgi:hypothetical protein